MPRQARLLLPGVPLHIRQRGVDRQVCFSSDGHYQLYEGLLEELTFKFACRVHAYVLMPNHVHLLLTAPDPDSTALFMKALGQRYAQYFNKDAKRIGHLWESRYRSSLIDSDRYLMICHRYIELNPVRAQMVGHPRQYRWSSYASNALGRPSTFIVPHGNFDGLGETACDRQEAYARLVSLGITDDDLALVRRTINSNRALGSPEFIEDVTRRLSRRADARLQGRPRASVPPDGKRGLSPV